MTRRIHLLIAIGSLLMLTPGPSASEESPAPKAIEVAKVAEPTATQVVEALHSKILEAMKNADSLGFDGRYALLEPVIQETFDLAFMGSKCVGRHWKQLDDDEKRSWLEKFLRLTTSNYAGRFNDHSGETFDTLGEEPAARDTRLVLTKITIPSADDVLLNYRMAKNQSGWRIIDVYLKGNVSELALRRSDFSAILKRDGFAKLSAAIDEKIEKLQQ